MIVIYTQHHRKLSFLNLQKNCIIFSYSKHDEERDVIRINLSDADIDALRHERYHHLHPRVQQKAEAILMKSQGFKHKDICKFMGISLNTFREYLREYQEGGIERIKEVRFHKPKSQLDNHIDTLENYFREHPVSSVKEAMDKIEDLTGLHRSENRVREFLKRIGMKKRKVGMIPAKADPEKQEQFIEQQLNPRLEEAKNGERTVFFCGCSSLCSCSFSRISLGIFPNFY